MTNMQIKKMREALKRELSSLAKIQRMVCQIFQQIEACLVTSQWQFPSYDIIHIGPTHLPRRPITRGVK
jgi:hypothetical protein